MKIVDANIIVDSHHSSEQMDLMLKQKTRTWSGGKAPVLSSNRLADMGTQGGLFQERVVDRVSISQNTQVEYQSAYSGEISSRSRVRTTGSFETKGFEQKKLMETIVGSVIDRDVVVRKIQQGENIDIDTGLARPTPSLVAGKNDSKQMSHDKIISLNRTDIHFEAEQMTFSSAGEVMTEDGRMIEFSLDLSMDRSFLSKTEQETLVHTWKERVKLTDPLVVSLDGSLPLLSDARFEFDLDNDGKMESLNFVSTGSGFLAFDKNKDQTINNGSELFGPGTGNGFEELAAWDVDHNGWIDENDDVFSKLSIWTRDENGDDQLISLKNAGIGAICLEAAPTDFDMTGPDNFLKGRLKSSGAFLFENGNIGSIQQIDLAQRPVENKKIKTTLNLLQNNPLPGILSPNGSSLVANPGSSDGQPAENPLETLMEQIKILKEEMNQLLGNRSSSQGFSQGINRFSVGSGLQKGGRPSNYQLYQMINPDTLILFPGTRRSMGQGHRI